MPISLTELVDSLRKDPALLLGAGASVPSGAPTGTALAHSLWERITKTSAISDDLLETTSLLSRRYGRSAVVNEIKTILSPLKPAGGLLSLPTIEWRAIFTTNFDQLVEAAYRRHKKPLAVFRSNYDFTRKEDASGGRLYKIHGCISQDRSTGDQSSLLLTEDDYDDYKAFRQASFVELERTLLQSDVLIVGQSLGDRHLQDLVKEVLKAKKQGVQGQVFLLAYDRDDFRAQLLEDRGAKVAFGGIDELIHAFAIGGSAASPEPAFSESLDALLSPGLVSTVRDLAVEVELPSNVVRIDRPALQIIATANSAQWTPRIKTRNFFTRGEQLALSALSETEIRSLLNLLENSRSISDLVQNEFKRESRNKQFDRLRQKCSADMFVCLKNIFANESLDTILLQEYDLLAEPLQGYYRFVAALEAVGTRVHRQLVLRMLNVSASQVSAVLSGLSGIIDEFDIKPSRGVYGWSTRHLIIAQKITEYKFSHVDELVRLFDQVIDNINPLEPLELQSIRAICDVDYGIGRIGDSVTRERLYRRLVALVPGERIPWHRLIREKLEQGDISETEYLIRDAAEAAGADSPIDRYKVRLLVLRSNETAGISPDDRLALLRKAFELAMTNTRRHKLDKYSYRELCNVAVELNRKGENAAYMDEAISAMREGADRIMDPDLDRMLHHFENVRARMH